MEPKHDEVRAASEKILSSIPMSCILPFASDRILEILDNIPSGVFVSEQPDGKISFANKKTLELYGMNPCNLTLKQMTATLKIYTPEGKNCSLKQLSSYRALFKGETTIGAPLIIERPDGKRFVFNMSSKPLYDKEGQANSAVTIFDDITERVKTQDELQESEERLKMAQRIAHVGSWEYFAKEDKALWSDELFRIFGMEPQQYGPNTTEYVTHIYPADREKINKTMEQLLFKGTSTPKISFDYRIVRKDGSIRTIHSERLVREIENGRPTRIAGIEQDVTERKQVEEKLAGYTKNLEELVEERTKQLQNAERLAAIGQTAGMIGHDIRNPLQAITGELFLMKQEIDDSADSQCKLGVQESLQTIQEQIEYINKIVSDLQDFAKTLKPEMAPVTLDSAIPQMLSTVNLPSDIQLNVKIEGNLTLTADATFLKRVIVNLATNAIQAMPQGGTLTIRAFKNDGGVNITVQDTGVGIPEEIKPKTFPTPIHN